ncbi:MAG: hypothetical protein COA80_16020 [Leeuwenhoekiella sp.]|nr:MAG: hypothetical protein COA80_16020 [Leeuwenhoekiella sp.]
MKKFITSILILFISLNLFSQDKYFKLPLAKTLKPTVIFNENIIGNESFIMSLGSTQKEVREQIKEVSILKDKQTRELSDFYNLTEQGILFVELKEVPVSKTQSELNEFFGLEKRNEIYIDGYLLENEKYSIALAAIKEIELVEPDDKNGLKNNVLNIWTLAQNERYGKIVSIK